ncbi:ATPase, T2SS/T4P/T4SS family [Vibrio hannami]|nr:ATPase, T2SS/T4P/T4SS family [Vibrio hannami]MDG3088980.1 ATPase, T2SS/T4P/T4SS family [Vibrio hannami]
MELEFYSSYQIATKLSQIFGISLVKPDDYAYESICQSLGLRELIISHHALPLALANQTLTLAITDPTNQQGPEDFQFSTNYQIKVVLADFSSISGAIRKLYGSNQNEELSQSTEPVSHHIHQILLEAVRKSASDIHFEPYEKHYRIRLRIDGILRESPSPPAQLTNRISTRLKVLSHLDISEKRLPQDGRMKMRLNENTSVDLRVSTLPTLWGEKIVLRLLDRRTVNLDIDELGFTAAQADLYRKALSQPQGMILITGPTGSGKSISLYSGLQFINSPEKNLSAAEDPIEINLTGVNQVQINTKIGFGFSLALRAFLRQDPDVVMIGEIRDLETAEIATKAAQTGHLVMSTLHTNSAPESISRLRNIGIKDFNLASSLSLVIAQRLCRKLCPECKIQVQLCTSITERLNINSLKPVYTARSGGCDKCNSGYLGRTGIYEVMSMTEELKAAVTNGHSITKLESICQQQGMLTLEQSGAKKIQQGITSYEELQRVLCLSW